MNDIMKNMTHCSHNMQQQIKVLIDVADNLMSMWLPELDMKKTLPADELDQ